MNTEENTIAPSEHQEIVLTKVAIDFLCETRKWGSFLAILGFVFIGLVLLAAAGAFMVTPFINQDSTQLTIFSITYSIVAVIYFFPIIYLYKFSKHLKSGISFGEPNEMESAFKNLKSLYKFMGIFSIVMLFLYTLMILGLIIGSVLGQF